MEERIKILCVDDERNVLKALRRLFMDEDLYDIVMADSGEEGLKILESEENFRLVISDYRMPGMNGVEFLSKVFKKWPKIVRIVLSGFADTAAVVEAINQGHIYKFLPKPWNDEELKAAIAGALELQDHNQEDSRFIEEHRTKTKQIAEMNEYLARLVTQRSEELAIRTRDLQICQDLLDLLPIAILGIDQEQMIVSCNKYSRELFPYPGLGPLGKSRHEVFSAEINALVDRLEAEFILKADIEINGQIYCAEVRLLNATLSQRAVLIQKVC